MFKEEKTNRIKQNQNENIKKSIHFLFKIKRIKKKNKKIKHCQELYRDCI